MASLHTQADAAESQSPESAALAAKRDKLLATIAEFQSCIVAFSGGVDSAVVAQAANLALGDKAVAATGVSASLAEDELRQARDLARQIGIRHVELHTDEVANPAYAANAPDRCYHCKTELYTRLTTLATEMDIAVIAAGTNTDDLGDYRPGLTAAAENRVRNPLAECGITKADVRQLAEEWSLPVWDKPASPCLSSRIAYGQQVTPERLRMIERAEQHLRGLGLAELRVRYHEGDLARIEVPGQAIARLADEAVRDQIVQTFQQLGFRYVTLDLAGFRSGSLNDLVPVESLTMTTNPNS